jgi:hypothetical protein
MARPMLVPPGRARPEWVRPEWVRPEPAWPETTSQVQVQVQVQVSVQVSVPVARDAGAETDCLATGPVREPTG